MKRRSFKTRSFKSGRARAWRGGFRGNLAWQSKQFGFNRAGDRRGYRQLMQRLRHRSDGVTNGREADLWRACVE
jgi:hypothetical protein